MLIASACRRGTNFSATQLHHRFAFDYSFEFAAGATASASPLRYELINAVAAHHKVELFETPVGFKYIGELITGQDRDWRRGERGLFDSPPHAGEDGVIAGLPLLRNGGTPWPNLSARNCKSCLSK